jgi:hypothetical protein
MLNEISYLKVIEWMAYSELEPFDEVRGDMRAASICRQMVGLFDTKPRALADFMLPFGKPKKEFSTQTIGEQKRIARLVAAICTTGA